MRSKRTQSVEKRPNDPEAWYLQGVAALEAGRIDGAVHAFLRAVELAPDGCEHALAAAAQLSRTGARREGELILRRALTRFPARPELRDGLVLLLIDDGRERVALAEATIALRADPEAISLRLLAATAYERLGQADNAIEQLASITARLPTHVEANRRLGTLLAETGDFAGALHCWRQVVAQRGAADHEALTTLGRQLSAAGEHREALRILYDVAAMKPALASAHANLGMALLASGHVQEAVRSFRRILELDAAWPSRDAVSS